MYTIFRNNRKLKPTFTAYEEARRYVRRLIRQNNSKQNDLFWTTNPMIGDYGFSIRKV